MVQTQRKFTLDEFLNYDDGTDTRYELEDGVLTEMPAESPKNIQIAIFLLGVFMRMGIPVERLGIKHLIEVVSNDATVREPDLVVHSEASAAAMSDTQAIVRLTMPPPALVVEVVSPGNEGSHNYQRDYVDKPKEYAARGIPEYWRIDPSRDVVAVLLLDGAAYQVHEFRGDERVMSHRFKELMLTAEQILNAGQSEVKP
jgi:Uma2 family endonuclease